MSSVLCVLALSARAADQPEDARWSALRAAAAQCPSPKAIEADFTQTRSSDLLADPVVTHGTFAAAGARAKWTTVDDKKATESVMALDLSAKTLTLFFPARKLAERYPVGERFAAFGALGAAPDFDQLAKFFVLESFREGDALLHLELVPREEALKAHVTRVSVEVARKSGVAVKMTTVDGAGDATELALANVRTPETVPDAALALVLPPETKVVEPAKAAGEKPR